MADNKYFKRAYGKKTLDETMELYDDWAAEYDQTVQEHGYQTPRRCAEALMRHYPNKAISILDIGCGTGLSGLALHQLGYHNITGSDLNAAMLARAGRLSGVYQELMLAKQDNPFDFEQGRFEVITAMGVIARNHAPPETILDVMNKLAPGGVFIFSLNDDTLKEAAYPDRVDQLLEQNIARCIEDIHGPHMTKLEMGSRVIVLEKL